MLKGCGTLALETYIDFWRGLTIQETATLAIKPGCVPTRVGAPTVEAGATLQVAQSGSTALQTGLTLRDGACLGFNFTDCTTAPVLNVSGKTVTFGSESNVVVKVSAADGIRAKGGKYTLTSGGKFANTNVSFAPGCPDWVKGVSVVDGEIVLNVKYMGMTIFVK